jgi:hypothetical protein
VRGRDWFRMWVEARRALDRKRRMRPTVLWIGRCYATKS